MDYLNPVFDEKKLHGMSALGLAHIGDGVYELMVRTWLCASGKATSKGLHREAVKYVSARAQAIAVEKIMPILTEAELAVYKRGRNAKVNSIPKKADISQYHAATGFESLFGYIYLMGDKARLHELFAIINEENI